MAVVITGNNTPTAGGVTYGDGTTYVNTAAGTAGQVLTSAGSSAPVWATVSAGFTLGTPVVTTSGTTAEFTSIPSTVKVIHVNYQNVSFSTASAMRVQLGTSSAYLTTGYVSTAGETGASGGNQAETNGFWLQYAGNLGTGSTYHGTVILTLLNSSTNIWTVSGNCAVFNSGTANHSCGGSVTLTDVLTRLRVLAGSTGNFDSGTINIAYI